MCTCTQTPAHHTCRGSVTDRNTPETKSKEPESQRQHGSLTVLCKQSLWNTADKTWEAKVKERNIYSTNWDILVKTLGFSDRKLKNKGFWLIMGLLKHNIFSNICLYNWKNRCGNNAAKMSGDYLFVTSKQVLESMTHTAWFGSWKKWKVNIEELKIG